jgi:hypothetical protein
LYTWCTGITPPKIYTCTIRQLQDYRIKVADD